MAHSKTFSRVLWLVTPFVLLLALLVQRRPSQGQSHAGTTTGASALEGRARIAQPHHRSSAQQPADSAVQSSDASAPAPGSQDVQTQTEPSSEPPRESSPQVVDVGVYVHHIPEIDLRSNTYLLDFYLWFRWSGSIDPTKNFEFTNAVQSWDQLRTPIYVGDDGASQPEQLDGGVKYQAFHVHGRFQHAFPLHAYPFDQQDIVLALEDSQAVEGALVYRVDTQSTGYHQAITLPGWQVRGGRATVTREHYTSNFGDPRLPLSGDTYSHFTYALQLDRPVGGYLAKVLIPLGIVLLISFVVFFMHPRYFESRVTISLTNLISAVALQLSSGADLPNVGYLVLLDRIYHLCYLTIFLCLAESVIVARIHDDGRENTARRIDRLCMAGSPLLFVLGLAYLYWRR
jgi:hypothetical protein